MLHRGISLELRSMGTPANTMKELALKFRQIQYIEHYPAEASDYQNALWGGLTADFDRLVGRSS